MGVTPLDSKVVRETRLREKTAGAAATEEDKKQTASDTWHFFSPQAEANRLAGMSVSAGQEISASVASANRERRPALDNLRQLEKCLSTFGSSLANFSPEVVARYVAMGCVPPCLVVCLDQEQMPWTALHFLARHCKVNLVGVHDPFHRRCNHVIDCLISSGVYADWVASLLWLNLRYGP